MKEIIGTTVNISKLIYLKTLIFFLFSFISLSLPRPSFLSLSRTQPRPFFGWQLLLSTTIGHMTYSVRIVSTSSFRSIPSPASPTTPSPAVARQIFDFVKIFRRHFRTISTTKFVNSCMLFILSMYSS